MSKLVKTARWHALPLLIWFFYNGLLMHNYGRFRRAPQAQNYLRNLADSFLQGRLDIDCPEASGCYDLLKYQEKVYLYWQPAPAHLNMPLIAILGPETPNQLNYGQNGHINVWLFSLFCWYFVRRFDLPLGFGSIALLTLFWGIGTVHFYMSMLGSIWCMAQVCAQTFLLLALIFALRRPSIANVLWSSLFFGLACYSRNHLLFGYALIGVIQWYQWEGDGIRQKLTKLAAFALPFGLLSVLNLGYNYARFDEAFNNGMEYQMMSDYLIDDFRRYGFFNLHYLPKNVWVQVLSPPIFHDAFPFFKLGWDKIGFSFFWASPLFLLLLPSWFFAWRARRGSTDEVPLVRRDRHLIAGATLSMLAIATPIMLNIAPGWRQFASRYSLDYQVFMIVLLLFLFKIWGQRRWWWPLVIGLTLLSLYVNYFGAYLYLNLGDR